MEFRKSRSAAIVVEPGFRERRLWRLCSDRAQHFVQGAFRFCTAISRERILISVSESFVWSLCAGKPLRCGILRGHLTSGTGLVEKKDTNVIRIFRTGTELVVLPVGFVRACSVRASFAGIWHSVVRQIWITQRMSVRFA